MPISVNEAICSDTGMPITIIRSTPGKYNEKGIWEEGMKRHIKAFASVQPIDNQIKNDHGHEHTDEGYAFFSNKPLQFSDKYNKVKSDVIFWDGKFFTLRREDDWSAWGNHKAFGYRENP